MRSNKLALMFALLSLCVPALAYDWSTNPGDGSPENPYQISEPDHLIAIGPDPNLLDKHFILTNDIIFEPEHNPAHVFTNSVIAAGSNFYGIPAFTGHFDGNGYQIFNLTIQSSGVNIGLFGSIIGSGTDDVSVQDLTLVNPSISGAFHTGSLIGRTENCKIENCHVIGGLVSYPTGDWMGGLIGGTFHSIIDHCTSSANVSGRRGIGGLIGTTNTASLIYCSASGTVSGNMYSIGGLLGHAVKWNGSALVELEEIVHCYATGNVHSDDKQCGGLIGSVYTGLVRNCYATGYVTGGADLGGLIGRVCPEDYSTYPVSTGPVTIKGCYASGTVTGQGDCIGGLIGRSDGFSVKYCYALGNVSGNAYVGGLIGYCGRTVACSFSKGRVTGTSYAGGLTGGGTTKAFFSYWDTQTSLKTTSAAGLGRTTAQMKSLVTYKGWGDNFWVLNEGNDYPHLAWENTPGQLIVDERSYSAGNGSIEDPYQLSSTADLITLGRYIQDWDKHFILTADIILDPLDLTNPLVMYANANFNKIGISGHPFTGHFKGRFHSISNLTNRAFDESYNGLFGSIAGNSPNDLKVQNLRILNAAFAGSSRHGGLAGEAKNAKIENCSVENISLSAKSSSTVPIINFFGGLIGYADNVTISRCSASGTFSLGSRSNSKSQGGLVGTLRNSTVENSYAICSFATAGYYDGGFIGESWYSNYSKCFSVPVSQLNSLNGFIGDNYRSTCYRCYCRSGTNINSSGASMLTDAQMKQRSSFANWDFLGESANGQNEIWRMCTEGVDYPRLSWESARSGDFACANGVDLFDLLALADHWLMTEADYPTTFSFATDANADTKIDTEDFSTLSANWP